MSAMKLDAASPDCIGEAVFGIGFKYGARVVRIVEPYNPRKQVYTVSFRKTTPTDSRSSAVGHGSASTFIFATLASANEPIPLTAPKYTDAVTIEFTVTASTIDILYSFASTLTVSSTDAHKRIATEMYEMLMRDIIFRHDFSAPLILTRKRKAETEAKAEN
jgi:hypothetical protein